MLALPIWFSASGINKLATPKSPFAMAALAGQAIGAAAAHPVASEIRATLKVAIALDR